MIDDGPQPLSALIQNQKKDLRDRVRALARQFSVQTLNFDRSPLRDFLAKESGIWGAFFPLGTEAQILKLLEQATHIQWAFPRVLENNDLAFHVCSLSDLNETSMLGVKEPVASSPRVELQKLKGALIPGQAFDRKGARLGRGRGHYDRFLKSWKGLKIGTVWSYGLVDRVPMESHDQMVDAVATEREMVWVNHL